MVYVPILKVDLPEPSIQELLPGVVHAFINTCTRVFDLVNDYLRPLSPEDELILYTATIEHLPKEFRKARKKIAENNIVNEDKMSEELEDASYAYYRRQMREYVAGYSDEETEDVTFRRMMSPYSPSRQVLGEEPEPEEAAGPSGQAAEAAAAASVAALPSRARRVTVTTVAGGAGLAVGAGVLKLAQLISRLRGKQKRKGRKAGPAAGGRRQSDAGKARRGGTARAGAPRTTPRTTPRQR